MHEQLLQISEKKKKTKNSKDKWSKYVYLKVTEK